MKLYICTTIQQEKATGGGGAKIRTAIFCCYIAPHLWLSFLKTILVVWWQHYLSKGELARLLLNQVMMRI